jgi:hypothetical protein
LRRCPSRTAGHRRTCPLIDLLKSYFDIIPDDEARRRREKIAGKILILDRALEDTLPYIFTLLEVMESDDPLARMDPEIRGAARSMRSSACSCARA